METITLNVDAVDTHRDKPTVSVFYSSRILESLGSRGLGFFCVPKTNPEFMSCMSLYFQEAKMKPFLVLLSEYFFRNLSLES